MKEHEKRCKVTAGQGISFPPKRKASGSNPLRNTRHIAESLDFTRFSAFLFLVNLLKSANKIVSLLINSGLLIRGERFWAVFT